MVGDQAFRASWRSRSGMRLLTGLGVGLALVVQAASTSAVWPLVPMAFAGLLCLWVSRELRSKHPVLRIGAEGLSSYWFHGRTIPWADIDGVHAEVVPRMGHLLVLTLRPGSTSLRLPVRSLVNRQGVRLVPLDALRRPDRTRAVDEVLRALAGLRTAPP